jgi:hypothetical protein
MIENERSGSLNALRIIRAEVQLNSRNLEHFFQFDARTLQPDHSSPYYAEEEIVTSLRNWTQNPTPQVLCIVGPSHFSFPPPLAPLAAHYVSLSKLAKVPVIHHSCTLPQVGSHDRTTRESSALITLIYSLVRQLVELIPPVIDGNHDFSAERFGGLDGTLNTLEEAIFVLNDLLDLSPPNLFCVIDGLQQLDDQSTDYHLKSMINTLRSKTKPDDQTSNRIKLLFTTAGASRALLDSLSMEELVLVEQSSVAQAQGQEMPGRQLLVHEL